MHLMQRDVFREHVYLKPTPNRNTVKFNVRAYHTFFEESPILKKYRQDSPMANNSNRPLKGLQQKMQKVEKMLPIKISERENRKEKASPCGLQKCKDPRAYDRVYN